jgi:hypothetical protein
MMKRWIWPRGQAAVLARAFMTPAPASHAFPSFTLRVR